jgi:hypothetical protein
VYCHFWSAREDTNVDGGGRMQAGMMPAVHIPFALSTGLGMKALHSYFSCILEFAVIKEVEASLLGLYPILLVPTI